MIVPLSDQLLLIEGDSSFLLIGKAGERFVLCIETTDDEYCQTVAAGDLIVVSAPEGGPVEQARMLLELVRTYHMPLLVLPRGHPGSKRLRMVVSVGPEVFTSCEIQRGTHPEQSVICGSEELAGIRVRGVNGGVEIEGLLQEFSFCYFP
jgi:hypothetical protein